MNKNKDNPNGTGSKQNWEISFEHHLKCYSEIDPLEASERTGLNFDPNLSRFSIDVFGYKIYADFPEFKLHSDNNACRKTLTGFQMQILAMRVLYSGIHAPLTGNYKAYRELPWGDLYDHNFDGRCIKRFAYGFGFKPDVFANAAKALKGEKIEAGDVAFEFDFMGGIKCRFILWKPDEEFPPSAQILFSDNAVLMYNAEDLAVVGDIIISALKEAQ